MSHNLSSVAAVIGAVRVNSKGSNVSSSRNPYFAPIACLNFYCTHLPTCTLYCLTGANLTGPMEQMVACLIAELELISFC